MANLLRVYEAASDTWREATQADIDRMQAQLGILAGFYSEMRRAMENARAGIEATRQEPSAA